MGYVNYIVLPEQKLLFEVSRETEEKNYNELFDFEDFIDVEKNFKNVSLRDLSTLVKIHNLIIGIHIGSMLFYLLKSYDRNAYIISEFDYDKDKKTTFKDFKIIRREL